MMPMLITTDLLSCNTIEHLFLVHFVFETDSTSLKCCLSKRKLMNKQIFNHCSKNNLNQLKMINAPQVNQVFHLCAIACIVLYATKVLCT